MKIIKKGIRWGTNTHGTVYLDNFGNIKLTVFARPGVPVLVLKAVLNNDTKRHFLAQLWCSNEN